MEKNFTLSPTFNRLTSIAPLRHAAVSALYEMKPFCKLCSCGLVYMCMYFLLLDQSPAEANKFGLPTALCPLLKAGLVVIGTCPHTGEPSTQHLRAPICSQNPNILASSSQSLSTNSVHVPYEGCAGIVYRDGHVQPPDSSLACGCS